MSAAAFEAGGVRWWPRPGLAAEAVRPRVEAALAALEGGAEDRKRGRRKQHYLLALGGEGQPGHLLKVNRYGAGRRRRSKSRHELAVAAALTERGLPAPVPLVAGERREGGRLVACYLLVEILPDVVDLREELWAEPGLPARRRALAEAFGALVGRLHDAGLDQDDLRPNNFLLRWRGGSGAATPELFVIDFERARMRRRVSDRRRVRTLAKLDRELARGPSTLRMRFLRAYSGGDAAATRARWRAVEAATPGLARRDAGHLYRNATVPGRRYERVRLADWTGIALPGLDPARLERAAERGARAEESVSGEADAHEWALRLSHAGLRHGRRVLARALVLAARGLAPEPLALLCGREASVLLLDRGKRCLAGHEVRRNAAYEAGCRVLERRLAAYGRTTRPLAATDLAVAPLGSSGVRAVLLAVEAFATRPRFAAGSPRE